TICYNHLTIRSEVTEICIICDDDYYF
nr:RecName: Full=Muscarinic toxin-like protein 1; Short=MTLP-1; AltName: Full=Muscarinic toxin-like protein 2; Short=MTLP-2 [Naja naja]